MIWQGPEKRAPEATLQNLMQLKISGIKSLTFGLLGKQPGAEQNQQPRVIVLVYYLENQQLQSGRISLGSPGKLQKNVIFIPGCLLQCRLPSCSHPMPHACSLRLSVSSADFFLQ